ncbi:hypothetical protein ACFQL1_22055 [Halomicroarcula sp. GCM10025709]|uniref:DUF7537 family lipoprotein n=1 Tax=Haloarcula TaxID=2237 RepID=UPI0024C243E4|nr:hypothetical protein [Halomicroarcula sp. YJ-61-S]
MRGSRLGVCLLALVVLAGCNGFGGAPAPETPSATDASVSGPAAVPGISDGRLTDPAALLAAHSDAMLAAGFENDYRANRSLVRDGQVVTIVGRQRTLVESNKTEYRYRVTSGAGAPSSRFDTWGNRSRQVVRGQVGDTVRYSTGPPASAADLTGTGALRSHLTASTFEVVDSQTSDGRYLVTLAATSTNASAVLPENGTDLRNYEARLVVDASGRVLQFEASGTYTVSSGATSEPGVVDVSYEVLSLGGRDIERPAWADTALANASQ